MVDDGGNVVQLHPDDDDPRPAYHLRKAGYSFQEISKMVGRSVPACMNDFREYQNELAKELSLNDREAMTLLELGRLDDLQKVFYASASHGDLKALEGVLKIMVHRMKLGGLDQANPVNPQQSANIIMVGGSQEEFIEALRAGRAQMDQRPDSDTLEGEITETRQDRDDGNDERSV